jgi:methionine-rich copper-binding protein CopC
MMKPLIFALLLGVLSVPLVGPALVEAHSHLHRSEPAKGSKLTASPAEIKLWFSENLEGSFSSVKVLNAEGGQVDNKDKQIDPKDGKLLRVTLPALPPGVYKVVYHAVSVDTHAIDGDFTFEVGQ